MSALTDILHCQALLHMYRQTVITEAGYFLHLMRDSDTPTGPRGLRARVYVYAPACLASVYHFTASA